MSNVLSCGTCFLLLNFMVSVPVVLPGIPCASCPISLPYKCCHVTLIALFAMRWRYSSSSLLCPSTALAMSQRNSSDSFWHTNCPIGMLLLMHAIIASCSYNVSRHWPCCISFVCWSLVFILWDVIAWHQPCWKLLAGLFFFLVLVYVVGFGYWCPRVSVLACMCCFFPWSCHFHPWRYFLHPWTYFFHPWRCALSCWWVYL